MSTLLMLMAMVAPGQAPPTAPPPAEVVDDAAIAAWVADLSSPDAATKRDAHRALLKAGPQAKAAVPELIKLVNDTSGAASEAIDVLGAIGPDAKKSIPTLVARLTPANGNVAPLERLVSAICRIEGPRIETTRTMLLSTAKCAPSYITISDYLRKHTPKVVSHLAELCGDTDSRVRQLAVVALANLTQTVPVGDGPKPDWVTLLSFAGESAKEIPPALEKLLSDEVIAVRVEAAQAIARVAPQIAEKCIPIVLALGVDAKTRTNMPAYLAAQIMQPVPDAAFRKLLPLFDHDNAATRYWAIQTVAYLPVKGPLEAVLKENASARMREAAAIAFGVRHWNSNAPLPALEAALTDADGSVRIAAAHALVLSRGAKTTVTAPLMNVFIDGLKQETGPSRLTAAHDLHVLGPPARAALPALKACLGDPTPNVALDVALAMAHIDPAASAEAIPVLIRSAREAPSLRTVEALGKFGPAASEAVAVLTPLFESTNLELRLVAAVVAARIEPARAEASATVLTKLLADPKLRCGLRNKAVLGLIHLGPSAKAAVPTMLAVFADKNANFKAEIAVAAVIIDLEAAKPALIWLREHLRSNSNQDIEDTYDILECLPLAGSRAKILVPELTALLQSKDSEIRRLVVHALRTIGPDAKDTVTQLKELASKDPVAAIRQSAADAIVAITRANPSK